MAPSFLTKIKKNPSLVVLIILAILAISLAICITLAVQNIISLTLPGDSGKIENLAWRIANFFIVIIILHIAVSKKAIDFFSNRKTAIRESLEDATKAKEEAEKRYAEVTDKLAKAKKEISDIYKSFREEGEKGRDILIEKAKIEAEKIHLQAETTADQEIRKARMALRSEAVDLAAEMAEKILKKNMTKKDLKRITGEYIKKTSELT
jgi:F-type H+-transporting ATPase subunit b